MSTQNLSEQAEKYVRLAISVASRFVSSEMRVEDSDAYGDALLALVEATNSYNEGEGVPFRVYAYRCMFNALESARRKAAIRVCESLGHEPPAPIPELPTPEHILTVLLAPLEGESTLETRDREMLIAYFLTGKRCKDIGIEYGITKMGVSVAIKRAIAVIRKVHAHLLSSDDVLWEPPKN